MHGSQKMNPTDFGDTLTLHQRHHEVKKFGTHIHVHLRMNLNIFDGPDF